MSKMSQISAEMDEQNIPEADRNSLINRVSEGMHAAEKRIDFVVKTQPKSIPKPTPSNTVLAWEKVGDDYAQLAQKVRKFADATHNVVTHDGKTYVKVGAYQYLAALLGIVPKFEFSPESTQTEVWCYCTLYQKGVAITSAVMYADHTEEFLKDKPAYAVLGMAQTRAFSRAMKNLYGYVMELAGYQSVGLEEIDFNKRSKNER